MSEILKQKVYELQNEFNRRLNYTYHSPSSTTTPVLLQILHDSSQELLEFAFGNFGKNLSELTHVLDMMHPDLVNIFDGNFSDENQFSKVCIQFLAMAEYAKNNDLNHVFPLLGTLLIKDSLDKNVAKKIECANYSKSYVRMINDDNVREQIRFSKKMQVIDLQTFYKKGEESWNAQPDNFKTFIRYDSAYMHELKQAEKKMKRYQELGCQSLASEIAKSIESFKENMEQTYYGFNRITMTNAAIILAKSMGYKYNPSYALTAGNYSMSTEPQVMIERTFFKDYYFDVSNVVEAVYRYEPKVYPYHELKSVASDEVLNTIKTLESFPEANNKPIFDHFGVIVPSINYRGTMFKSISGILQDHVSNELCCKELDKVLIKNKYYYPIIIGEKDGKCFFICYWT
jgi:hypothetical protein